MDETLRMVRVPTWDSGLAQNSRHNPHTQIDATSTKAEKPRSGGPNTNQTSAQLGVPQASLAHSTGGP